MSFDYSQIETLTEIKKGQHGTGLLIENDGHIIGNCDTVNQIREDINAGHQLVCPDHFVVPALFQKYGIKNANGRIYPEDILKREVETYITERVNNRCALGSLDHPQNSGLSGHDVAHNITELHWEGQSLLGELEINTSPGFRKYGICTTSGDHVANLLINNYLIGVSSRGVGSVKSMPGGVSVVGEDFSLICWDVVLEPSTPGAFIGKNKDDLNRYVESATGHENHTRVDERIRKIAALLN